MTTAKNEPQNTGGNSLKHMALAGAPSYMKKSPATSTCGVRRTTMARSMAMGIFLNRCTFLIRSWCSDIMMSAFRMDGKLVSASSGLMPCAMSHVVFRYA